MNPLVAVAESFLGVKYRRGGSSIKAGFDCSAYVQKVFRVVGVDLPRTAREPVSYTHLTLPTKA